MRNPKYDFLRAVGLVLVILAHVSPPNTILQLRCFDVPLMIFVSGLVVKPLKESLASYYKKRTLRLVVPVYLFITFLLSGYYIAGTLGILPLMDHFGEVVLKTYCLSTTEGLGYVWIIRVFLLMMFITPLLIKWTSTTPKFIMTIVAFAVLLFVNMMNVNSAHVKSNLFLTELFRDIIQYTVGYGLILAVSIRLKSADKKSCLYFYSVVVTLFALSLFYYIQTHGLPVTISQDNKYPPQWYFLIFGLFMSISLYILLDYASINLISNKLIGFLGKNTIWIYLWHIPFIDISGMVTSIWVLRWLIVLCCATAVYFCQYKVVRKFLVNYSFSKYLIG